MMKWLAVIVTLLFSSAVHAEQLPVDLISPQTTAVPAGITSSQVEQSILLAAKLTQWTVLEQNDAQIVLKYLHRDFSATVAVGHSDDAVTVSYRGSEGLQYTVDNGQPMIDPKYNEWAADLAKNIRIEMLVLTLK